VVHVIREGQDNVQDLEFKDGKTDELGWWDQKHNREGKCLLSVRSSASYGCSNIIQIWEHLLYFSFNEIDLPAQARRRCQPQSGPSCSGSQTESSARGREVRKARKWQGEAMSHPERSGFCSHCLWRKWGT
jgi:hypothetical protein